MQADLLYQIALTEIPTIGHVHAKTLIDHFGTAENVFRATQSQLEKLEGISPIKATNIKHFKNFKAAETEIKFIQKYKIECIFINDPRYPKRLLNCYDPPILLFYRGTAGLNESRYVSIIGTRSSTDYGKSVTEKLVQLLQSYNVIIISGLAFGIDAFAHKAAIKNEIPTIGVLAHGLDTLYPSEHSSLAKNMMKNGGLLTEFKSNTKPDKHNFPSRNRVVAGMSDAVIVIESGVKGGSLITADLANGYNRDVFAVPGKITDTRSLGCNLLIKNHKAILLNEPAQFPEFMGWDDDKLPKFRKPKLLFEDLTENEQVLVKILHEISPIHIDELMFQSGLSSSLTASAVLTLELKSIIVQLPGKKINLV